MNFLFKSKKIFVFIFTSVTIFSKKSSFILNSDDSFLIWEKSILPFVCKDVSNFLLFFSFFKLITLLEISKSKKDPFLTVITKTSPSFSFLWFISVVKFLIESYLVKLIDASDIFPENQ